VLRSGVSFVTDLCPRYGDSRLRQGGCVRVVYDQRYGNPRPVRVINETNQEVLYLTTPSTPY